MSMRKNQKRPKTKTISAAMSPAGQAAGSVSLYAKRPDPRTWLLKGLLYLSIGLCLLFMGGVVFDILVKGIPYLSWDLFSPEYTTDNVSLMPALINTVLVIGLSLLIAAPLGVGGAIWLCEYTKTGSRFSKTVGLAAEALSGIPSIVFGLFGSIFFVKVLHMGLSLLAGSLTMAMMLLPLILRTSQQALQEVPALYREGSYGLGAGKLRTIFQILLPQAAGGILSGITLSVGKAAGESAALLFTAGTVAQIAPSLLASGRTLAVHMYALSSEGLHVGQAYATAVILLVVVLMMNGLSHLAERKALKMSNGNG